MFRELLEAKDPQKVIDKIAKQERVNPSQVIVSSRYPSDDHYIVTTKPEDDKTKKELQGLLDSFDTQIWAIDRGYFNAKSRNDNILGDIGKSAKGKMIYHTGPTQSRIEVKF